MNKVKFINKSLYVFKNYKILIMSFDIEVMLINKKEIKINRIIFRYYFNIHNKLILKSDSCTNFKLQMEELRKYIENILKIGFYLKYEKNK
jgi:hypothetical protein